MTTQIDKKLIPTYSNQGIELYLGDSELIVPQLTQTFDLVATDPPYKVNFQSRRKKEKFNIMHGDSGEINITNILKNCVSKLRHNRHMYVFGPTSLVAGIEKLTSPMILIWDKELIGMGNLSLPYGPAHEPINFMVHVPSVGNKKRGDGRLSARLRQGSVIKVARLNASKVKRHPTEKPVKLMRQIIESSSCLEEIVFDPFMGSGSTIVAAILEGRKAVGIEIDPQYFEIAKNRVDSLLKLMNKLNNI